MAPKTAKKPAKKTVKKTTKPKIAKKTARKTTKKKATKKKARKVKRVSKIAKGKRASGVKKAAGEKRETPMERLLAVSDHHCPLTSKSRVKFNAICSYVSPLLESTSPNIVQFVLKFTSDAIFSKTSKLYPDNLLPQSVQYTSG